MKKWIIVFLMFCLLVPECIKGKVVNLYLFYGDGCPHCEKEKKFLNKYLEKESDVKLYTYEVWFDEENASKLEEVQKITKKKSNSIPYLIIGNNVISGFMEDYTEDSIINTINYYKGVNYDDKVGKYLGVVSEEEIVENNTKYENNIIKIPLIGKIDIKNASLALVAIVIGLVDGFNPCAMWILLDRKSVV